MEKEHQGVVEAHGIGYPSCPSTSDPHLAAATAIIIAPLNLVPATHSDDHVDLIKHIDTTSQEPFSRNSVKSLFNSRDPYPPLDGPIHAVTPALTLSKL